MLTNMKQTLGVLFATSFIIANVVATKIVSVGPFSVSAGFLGIGIAFLCSDLLAEIEGKKAARDVVNATIIGLLLAQVLIFIALEMEPAPFFNATESFQTTLGGSSTVIIASLITAFVSQNIDVIIFEKLKEYTNGSDKWVRNIGSTASSQLLDTAMFSILAFAVFPHVLGGTLTPWSALLSIIVGEYIVKLIVALLDTPLFYLLTIGSEE